MSTYFTPLMYYFQFMFDVPKHFPQLHMSQPLTSIFYTGDLPSTKYMIGQAKCSSFTYLNVTPLRIVENNLFYIKFYPKNH